jgi:hypothetical protein
VIQLQLAAEIADLQTCIKQGRALLKEGFSERQIALTWIRQPYVMAEKLRRPRQTQWQVRLLKGHAALIAVERQERSRSLLDGFYAGLESEVTQGLAQELGLSYHGPPQASLGIAPPSFATFRPLLHDSISQLSVFIATDT